MTARLLKVLLVEDAPEDVRIITQARTTEKTTPFDIVHSPTLAEGLARLAAQPFDVVLLDLWLPDSKGLNTLTALRRQARDVPVVVLTATDDEALAAQVLRGGAQDYLVKGYIQVYGNLLGRALRYAVERKRAEEQLSSVHAQTEHILAALPSILIGISTDGRVTHWNTVAETTFAIPADAALGRPLASCEIRWDVERILSHFREAANQERASRLDDVAFTRRDSREGLLGFTVVPMRGEGQGPSGFLLFGADITERKHAEAERVRLQEELNQAQKMETVGRFAGGIAHDFNNFLQVILGFAWLIRARRRDDRELQSDLQEIVHAAESASGMVRQLLAFSRRQVLQPKLLEMNSVIQSMGRLLQQFVGERIQMDLRLSDEPLTVRLDPTGLEQVIMNLCSNARDSMGQGGTLSIATGRMRLDAAFTRAHTWAKEGDYVRLSVKDSGTGMDQETARRIFEPFFTTKQKGKGTGLGLAVVYGVVTQHGGLIDIETAPGQGTAFHLYFPHETATDQELALRDPSARQAKFGEVVFIVESDERQRALAEEILRESGYQVAGSCEVTHALQQLGQAPARIDALVFDASIPGGTVRELLEHLRTKRPGLRVLLVSGYVDEELRRLESAMPGILLLPKPYVPAQLLDQLRQLLDAPAQPSQERTDGQGRSRVLVVDDDAPIRLLCQRILQERYDVTIVTTATSALDSLSRDAYDLLLTDLKMSDVDGVQLILRARKLRPGLKVLAMSGVMTPELEGHLRAAPLNCQVIRKPFTADELQHTVSRCF